MDIGSLRGNGWLFDTNNANESWYRFYTLFGMSFIVEMRKLV